MRGPLAERVVLVGLMGAGKTTVGRRVANRLGVPFHDADEVLVQRSGLGIAEWFSGPGEVAFREAEADLLDELLAGGDGMVVATGGGVVTLERARRRLSSDDVTVVWLRATPSFLAARVVQKDRAAGRPLLGDDPLGVLTRLDQERAGWYEEVADLVVDIDPVHQEADKPKRRLAELVVEALAAGAST